MSRKINYISLKNISSVTSFSFSKTTTSAATQQINKIFSDRDLFLINTLTFFLKIYSIFSIREAIDNPRQKKQRNISSGHTSTSHRQQCFTEKGREIQEYICTMQKQKKAASSHSKTDSTAKRNPVLLLIVQKELYIQSVFAEHFGWCGAVRQHFNSCP